MTALDPAVAPVERLLGEVAEPRDPSVLMVDPLPVLRAMWLCCCYQEGDAPTWLLVEAGPGELGWCRVPDAARVDHLVRSRQWSGAHTDAGCVLSWIRGSAPDPWMGERGASAVELEIFTRLVRAAPPAGLEPAT